MGPDEAGDLPLRPCVPVLVVVPRGSMVRWPPSTRASRHWVMYRIWHSEWKIRLPPWARLVPGPYMQKKLGNPGTVMPR